MKWTLSAAVLLASLLAPVFPSRSARAADAKPAAAKPAKPAAAAAIDAKSMVPLDLARGKAATASSTQGGDDHLPSNAFDGDNDTRWCAANGDVPQWLQVDLGKPEELTGCKIIWEKEGVSYQYKIEGSVDAKTWFTLADATKGDVRQQVREHKFEACCGNNAAGGAYGLRYVKLTITGLPEGGWASLYAFEVFGKQMVAAGSQGAPHAGGGASASSGAKPAAAPGAGVKAPAGFDVTVFAAPPDVGYPTCVTTTPDGVVFVGIDEDGSLGKLPDKGRVVRCVDSTGSGKADKFTLFAKMDHPRGLVWDAGKLYVLHPPFLTVYYDENGDGVADRSEDLLTGISTEATVAARGADHTTNGIRMGIDGWIYIAMGDFGCLKAVGKDGVPFQFHGGGVMRVRPDGTGLEAYARYMRNIYDVAIDPLMNVFTRDNTNDGDNWNDRLAYDVPSGNYGYPSRFMHFPGEFIDCLNDYGGGSPCGSLFTDEPAAGDLGHCLLTVEWGRSALFRHPLTAQGAGYKTPVTEEKVMDLPRGTDIDVDALGRFYLASWANGGFSYSGPHVGYLLRMAPQGAKPTAVPDFAKAADDQLVQLIASPSGVLRLAAQRELLHRADKLNRPHVAEGLQKLAASNEPLVARVAAIFTLKQLMASSADKALEELTKKDDLREFALRALADRRDDTGVPVQPFIDALKDPNPRVRLQAAWGLGRLGRTEAAAPLVPLVGDADFLVAHVAINSLVTLKAIDPCLKAVDPGAPTLIVGALRVLQQIHDPAVVDGLTARLAKAQDAKIRGPILAALCRLYYREADWDGSWWGTRPDTTGPYYKTAEWAGTEKVKAALASALTTEKPDVLPELLLELHKHKIELPGQSDAVAKAAAADPAFRNTLVASLAGKKSLTPDQVKLVEAVATSEKEPAAQRVKAIRLLSANAKDAAALDPLVDALAPIVAAEKPDAELSGVLGEFMHDPKLSQNIPYFGKLAGSDSAPKRELAYAALVNIANSRLAKPEVKASAAKVVEKGWEKPAAAASLLRAIGRVKADGYKDWIEAMATDPNADVVKAAAFAAERTGLKGIKTAGPAPERVLIETLGFDKTVEMVKNDKGEAALGEELFTRQGCIACHTTAASQPPKGPMLAGIAVRYSRGELCESIMKPSARIAQGFETQFFKTKDGDIIEGFVTREAGDEVELRNITGITTVVKKADIASRGKRDTSVMPEGLVIKLTPHELASIVAFLESLKAN